MPPLARPTFLRGYARKAWDEYISIAFWLDKTREPAAIAFCELWAEFRTTGDKFTASRHGQLRNYMNELGLTDERNRRAPDKARDPASDYF